MFSYEAYEHLYGISIDILDLSETGRKILLHIGATTIGDCIDFYRRAGDAMIQVRYPTISVMYGEIKQQLIEHGYWSYVENDNPE